MIKPLDLQQIPLFSSLDQETCHAIAQYAFKRDVRSGKTLVIEGMAAESCYFLAQGCVRVLRMSLDGRVQVLARLGPGEPLNIISLLTTERVNRASIEALTPVSLFVLDASAFDTLLAKHPDFSAMLLRMLAERMAKMTDLAADLSLHTVRARLAHFLMHLAEHPQSAGGWTQDEIAAHIGTVRDVVGRLLREFEANGLITRDRQQIKLLDRDGLIQAAENE